MRLPPCLTSTAPPPLPVHTPSNEMDIANPRRFLPSGMAQGVTSYVTDESYTRAGATACAEGSSVECRGASKYCEDFEREHLERDRCPFLFEILRKNKSKISIFRIISIKMCRLKRALERAFYSTFNQFVEILKNEHLVPA